MFSLPRLLLKLLLILLKCILFKYNLLIIGYIKLKTKKYRLIPRSLKIKINITYIYTNISTISIIKCTFIEKYYFPSL